MNFSDHFPRTQGFYNQNPHKVQFAAGVSVTTTVAASVLARVTSAPLPKTAKLTIFGLTFVSNLASLNMKDASLGELAKVMMVGKDIVNNVMADVKNVVSEYYGNIIKALQTEVDEVKVDLTKPTPANMQLVKLENNTLLQKADLLPPQVKSNSVSLPQQGKEEVISVLPQLLTPELMSPDQTSAESTLSGSDLSHDPTITSTE